MWTVDGGKYRKPGAEAKALSQSVPSAGRWPTALDRYLSTYLQQVAAYIHITKCGSST